MNEPTQTTVVIGADHGGFPFLAELQQKLHILGYQVINYGAETLDENDDYPAFAFKVSEKVAELEKSGKSAFGLLLCRSGAGMTIAANKVTGIRAVTAHTADQVMHARQHNKANVLSLSGDWLSPEQMWELTKVFVETPFSGDERHQRRVQQIAHYES